MTATNSSFPRRSAAHQRRGAQLIVQAIHHAGAGHLGGPLSAADILVASTSIR